MRRQTGHDIAEQARILVVSGKRQVADGMVELVCEPADGDALPRWAPGAHVDLVLGPALARPYSRARDVLGSGTCGNGGCLAELWGRRGRTDPPALHPGGIVELTVEGIGTVRNLVVPGLTLTPVRAARARSVSRVRERG